MSPSDKVLRTLNSIAQVTKDELKKNLYELQAKNKVSLDDKQLQFLASILDATVDAVFIKSAKTVALVVNDVIKEATKVASTKS